VEPRLPSSPKALDTLVAIVDQASHFIDTNTWKTIKRFDNVGVDCQTMAPSYDGK
jgi:hypothetical protein